MVGALTGNFSPELLNDVPLQFSTEEYKLMFLDLFMMILIYLFILSLMLTIT